MKHDHDEMTFSLDAVGIDSYSDHLDEVLGGMGVERRNALRIRLTIEEALLRMRDHFGDRATVSASVGSGLGGPSVNITHVGQPFNPLGADEAAVGGGSLPTMAGLRVQYSYVGDKNVLRLPFPRPGKNPALTLLLALGTGAVVGFVGMPLLRAQGLGAVVESVFDPLFGLWVRTLNALAAPVIFFMALSTLLDMRKVDEQGGNRHVVLLRYFALSITAGLGAVAVAAAVYRPPSNAVSVSAQGAAGVLDSVSQLIPEHILEPFVTSNTAQLLLLAFVLGNAIIALGTEARQLTNVVQQVNLTTSLVTKWVSSVAPLFSGLLLVLEIWDSKTDVLAQLWRPLVLALALSAVFMVVELAYLCVRFGASPVSVAKKLWPPFAVAIKTGTLDDAYGEAEHSCVQGLGIHKTLTGASLPQGLLLYMPASIMGTLVFTVFSAAVFGTQTNVFWYVTAVVLDVAFFVATPSVPGANLLAFIALFQQLGIPQEAFLDAMIFDILFGLFANAANQSLLQIELTLQADRLGMLNRKVLLRNPSSTRA